MKNPELTPSAQAALMWMREGDRRLLVSRRTDLTLLDATVNAATAAALIRAGVAYSYQALKGRSTELGRYLGAREEGCAP